MKQRKKQPTELKKHKRSKAVCRIFQEEKGMKLGFIGCGNMAGAAVTKVAGKPIFTVKKYSPEILLAGGIAAVIGGTVMFVKANNKFSDEVGRIEDGEEPIFIADEKGWKIRRKEELEPEAIKDRRLYLVKTAIKTYWPAASVMTLGIMSICGSYNILNKRNVAIAAAYKLVDESYTKYRDRVIDEFGKEKDIEFRTGTKAEKVEKSKTDKDGKEKKEKKTEIKIDPNGLSDYAKFFDEASPQWSKTPEYNLTFLKCQQNHANDLLHSRGHVFLNEV